MRKTCLFLVLIVLSIDVLQAEVRDFSTKGLKMPICGGIYIMKDTVVTFKNHRLYRFNGFTNDGKVNLERIDQDVPILSRDKEKLISELKPKAEMKLVTFTQSVLGAEINGSCDEKFCKNDPVIFNTLFLRAAASQSTNSTAGSLGGQKIKRIFCNGTVSIGGEDGVERISEPLLLQKKSIENKDPVESAELAK